MAIVAGEVITNGIFAGDELISENPCQSGWDTGLWWVEETSDVCKQANFKTFNVCKRAKFRKSETNWKQDRSKDASLTVATRR